MDYIKEENAYTKETHLVPNATLADTIYEEILSRINEDDMDVPSFHKPYYHYSRTVKGQQYPIICRKKDSLEGKEEVLLDLNLRTEEYIDRGSVKVSPDHKLLAFALDFNGSEYYTIYFKDLATGEILVGEQIENTAGSIEWAADSKTIWYSTLDDIHRTDKVFRHKIGQKEDTLIFSEPDAKFGVGFGLSLSKKYLFVSAESTLTTEVHFLPADTPEVPLALFRKREENHRYDVEHQGLRFLIRSNMAKKVLNYNMYTCPVENVGQWTEALPYDPYQLLEEVIPFANHIALVRRSGGLRKIEILETPEGKMEGSYDVAIDAVLYAADTAAYSALNYDSTTLRFSYSTPVSSTKVVELDMNTRAQTILKEKVVPGGFDPSKYTMETISAPIHENDQVEAPYGTPVLSHVPMSIIYRTDLFKKDGSNPGYLYGYGSYGISIDSNFSPSIISLVDRGLLWFDSLQDLYTA